MKNVKKIGIALILVAVIAVGIVVGVMADDSQYTGELEKFETLVQAALDAETAELKNTALDAVEAYITEDPVDPATEGYAEAAELYLQAKLGAVDLYLQDVAASAENADAMVKNAEGADKWFLSAFDTDESKADARYAEYLAKVNTSNVTVLNALYDAVDQDAITKTSTDTATGAADGKFRVAKHFFLSGVYDAEQDDYKEISAKMTALDKLHADAVEARYQDLISQAKMSDYSGELKAYVNNFEGSGGLPTLSNYSGYDANGKPIKNTGTKVTEEFNDGVTKNSYYELQINGAKNEAGTSYVSTYFTLSFAATNSSFVMQMDLSTKTTLPNGQVYFQSRPSAGTNTWMILKPNGDITDHNGNVLAPKAVVPGQWTNIAIVCELENIKQSRLYVDYAFVGYVNGDHKNYQYTPGNMRIGNSGYSSGQLCVDNINIHYGASIVDLQYMERMDQLDKFIYLSDYMTRTGADEVFIKIPDCVTAYDKAAEIADQFYYVDANGVVQYRSVITDIEDEAKKAEAMKAVDTFVAYDPTDIIVTYKKMNLDKYKALVDALVALAKAPTSSSISNRNSQVIKIQNFIDANGGYIFKPGDDNRVITLGSGTAADPFILTHGDQLLQYNAAATEDGWIYCKYIASDDGVLSISTSTEGAIMAFGDSQESILEVSDTKITANLIAGEELWFAIKTSGAAAASDDGEESTDGEQPELAYEEIAIAVTYDLPYNYDDLYAVFSSEMSRIEQDQVIYNFITTMSSFNKATSATLLQSLYDKAAAIVAEGLNTSLLEEEAYADFKTHYEETYANAPSVIAAAVNDANARDIIAAINYLLSTYPDEEDWKLVYIENPTTDEEIANNAKYDFIDDYVVLIRSRLSGGNYNANYISPDGTTVDMVVQRFSAMNDYYYGILQNNHVEHLKAQLDVFATSQSYIEKKGIISYIQRYFNVQDVDFTVQLTCENDACASCGILYNGAVDDVAAPTCPLCDEAVSDYRLVSSHAGVSEMLEKYRAYEAELAPQEGDYDALLSQNTIYFLNTVKKFDTAITYVDKLALLNEAMPFYYAMNIGSDDVVEAIAKYDALAAELAVVQDDSKRFIECVLLLPAILADSGIDAYYVTLVEAATLRDKIDVSIEGVTEAIASYEEAVADYNEITDTVNGEIKEGTLAIGSFSANCGLTAVISVVLNKLFSFA